MANEEIEKWESENGEERKLAAKENENNVEEESRNGVMILLMKEES